MQAIKQKHTTQQNLLKTAVLVLLAFCLAIAPVQHVIADRYDDQIRELQQEVNQYQNQAGKLRSKADTLKNQVAAINAEKQAIQTQITVNTAKLKQLNARIVQTNKEIKQQKNFLGNNLVTLYLDSSITPLEVLASSKSISEFIDKQEYRETIRAQLQESIAKVKELQEKLSKQKVTVENTIEDQKAQRKAVAAKEAEQANLLAQTQGQEAAYKRLSTQRNKQIANLRAQQAAANASWGGNVNYQPRGGGYPSYWADIPLDSTIDDWLMYNRECVSYTAFKVGSSGRFQPTGFGNANQWPGNARSRGIAVDRSPRVGDVAVWPVGYYGHVMYVEAVAGDGSIYISEYNFDWTGRYSERSISHSTWQAQGFEFIHF